VTRPCTSRSSASQRTCLLDRRTAAKLCSCGYQGTIVDDFPRWDFGNWEWQHNKSGVRVHYTWREFDDQLAVTSTTRRDQPWRSRWIHGEWWLEIKASQPALEACLR